MALSAHLPNQLSNNRSVQVTPRQRWLKSPHIGHCTKCWTQLHMLNEACWPHIQPLWLHTVLCSCIPCSFPPVIQTKCTARCVKGSHRLPCHPRIPCKEAKSPRHCSSCEQEYSCTGCPAPKHMKNKYLWPPSSLHPNSQEEKKAARTFDISSQSFMQNNSCLL